MSYDLSYWRGLASNTQMLSTQATVTIETKKVKQDHCQNRDWGAIERRTAEYSQDLIYEMGNGDTLERRREANTKESRE